MSILNYPIKSCWILTEHMTTHFCKIKQIQTNKKSPKLPFCPFKYSHSKKKKSLLCRTWLWVCWMDFAAPLALVLQCLSIKNHSIILPFLGITSLHYDRTDEIESVCTKGNRELDYAKVALISRDYRDSVTDTLPIWTACWWVWRLMSAAQGNRALHLLVLLNAHTVSCQ